VTALLALLGASGAIARDPVLLTCPLVPGRSAGPVP
jgi:hypothetical protein